MAWTHDRARVASLSRSRTPDDPDLVRAREDLRTSRLEEAIKRAVEQAPPLTDEQRSRLSGLLAPSRPDVA